MVATIQQYPISIDPASIDIINIIIQYEFINMVN